MSVSGQDHPLCHMFCLACFTVTRDEPLGSCAAAYSTLKPSETGDSLKTQEHVIAMEACLIQPHIPSALLYFPSLHCIVIRVNIYTVMTIVKPRLIILIKTTTVSSNADKCRKQKEGK